MMVFQKTPAGAGVIALPASIRTPTARGPIEHIDAGQGPALLALHGGMGGYDQSWLLARALVPDVGAWRIIAPSRPGYGRTPLTAGGAPEQQADAMAALLDALGVPQAVVAGVSAGGPPALQFALRHPDRCRALILVSAATGRLDIGGDIMGRLRAMNVLAKLPGLPALLRWRVARDPRVAAARSIHDPDVLERTLHDPEAGPLLVALLTGVMDHLGNRLPGTGNDMVHLANPPDFPFERLLMPVLVIHGTDDRIVPFSHGLAVVRRAPRARLLDITGGEHVALFTHLRQVRAAVAAFLAQG
ncbi:alpha/beta hydrolase [Nitrospirillum sp. BR 11163]|uniref:alpha/beta fold hydrolase n=1 Tax=Nitrospirillum sp. BR 11163 TaxID=3104323 RepID=UPI002AFF96B5|nr:alpha/beta hydrolase [Nitrospirillum sp. BR 11163]MEA1672251.1 alpha/beta hydrolase [Nitrospirillum sp. BR 11163]